MATWAMRFGAVSLAAALATMMMVAACGDDDDGGPGGGTTVTTGTPSGTGTGAGVAGAGATGSGTGGAGGSSAGGGGSGGVLPCGSEPTFADGLSPASEIHVDPSGDDSTGDGSAGSPYATIQRAAQDATAGVAIVVHQGTYGGDNGVSDLSGTAQAPIWIGGAPGESRPVLDGGGSAIHLQSVRYLVVHDLEVRNATQNGINCDDGGSYADPDATRYVVFRDLYIHDIGSGGNEDCLKLSGVDDYWVLDSDFARCGGGQSGSGIDHVGCHHGVIAGCSFTDMVGSGNGIQCKGGSEDILIRRNHFVDAGERSVNMGGSTGFTYFRPPLSTTSPNAEARNIRVVANVIEGATSSLAFVGCVGCLAANNTIVDPNHWILRILQETVSGGGYEFLPCGDNTFANNLVYFSRSQISTYVNIGPDTDQTSFTFRNDLWYAHDDPSQSQPTLPVAETGGVVGQDPLLGDPGNGDFTIDGASPAAGAGVDVGITGDYTGACYDDPPSIGAYEVP